MDMTPEQIDELLELIRAERGDSGPDVSRNRIIDLLEAEDLEATAGDVLELAESELRAARKAEQDAETAADEALRCYSSAHYRVRRMRHELALVRTATGYKTARQAQADAVAARTAETLAGRMPEPAGTNPRMSDEDARRPFGCDVCGSREHIDVFHRDPATGLIGGLPGLMGMDR